MAADRFPGRPRAREDRRASPAAPRRGGTTNTGYLLKPPSNPTGATRVAISPVPRSKEATSARPASAPHRHNHAMTVANIFIAFRCAGSVRLIQSPLVLSMSPPELLRRSPVPLRFPFSVMRTVSNGGSHCKPHTPLAITHAGPFEESPRWIPSGAGPAAPRPPRSAPVGPPPGTVDGRR